MNHSFAFMGFVDVVAHLGVKAPKYTQKGTRIGILKSNLQNSTNDILSKLLNQFLTNFAQR